MKHKYIEELVGKYYLHPEGDVISDILTSRGCDDLVCNIPTEAANILVEERDLLVDALILAINKNGDDAFNVYLEIRDMYLEQENKQKAKAK